MAEPVQITLIPDGFPGRGPEEEDRVGPLEVRGGERITGTVEVRVLEDVDFRALRLGFVWHTEGKGNRVTAGGGAETLDGSGAWRAGERLSFPFSVVVPHGPLSYKGKLLSVVWALEARLERSMLRHDVVSRIPVVLSPDPEGERWDLGPVAQEKERLEAVKRGMGAVWVGLGLFLAVGGIVWGALRGWDFVGPERGLLFLGMAGGFLLMLRGIWGRLGRGKLGEPAVQLSTAELRLGEEIRFSLVLRPEQRTEIRSLTAILECEERVVHGHGQYRSYHRKTVFERRLSLAKDQLIEPHRGFRKKGTLTLPEDGPTTFGAQDNLVVWWLRFQADIAGWPDWKEPFLLTVRP